LRVIHKHNRVAICEWVLLLRRIAGQLAMVGDPNLVLQRALRGEDVDSAVTVNNLAAQEYQKQSERDDANGAACVDESPPTLLSAHPLRHDDFGRQRTAATDTCPRRLGDARVTVWACNEPHQS